MRRTAEFLLGAGAVLWVLAKFVFGQAIVNELSELCPFWASRIVRWAARRLPRQQERFEEEWLGVLEETPGKLTKLVRALWFVVTLPTMRRALREPRRGRIAGLLRSLRVRSVQREGLPLTSAGALAGTVARPVAILLTGALLLGGLAAQPRSSTTSPPPWSGGSAYWALGGSPGPATRWWLPGLASGSDTRATLVIANPGLVDAYVDITVHLTPGSLHLPSLRNVLVKAHSTVLKDTNVPEIMDLSYTAEVVATQGAVVVGARMDTHLGTRRQRLVVPAQPAMRSSWAFAGYLSGEERLVELLVTNPNPNPLSLIVEGTNDQGAFKVAGFDLPVVDGGIDEVLVPVTLNLGGTGGFALRVRSQDGSKFVAALRYGVDAGPINTTHFDLGGSGLDLRWVASSVPASRRLVLTNTASRPVTATISGLGRPGAGVATQAGHRNVVTIQPGQVRVADVPKNAKNLLLVADAPGLVVAPVWKGQLVPGARQEAPAWPGLPLCIDGRPIVAEIGRVRVACLT